MVVMKVMNAIKRFLGPELGKFKSYSIIGVVFSLLNIVLLYIFIDIFNIPTIVSGIVVVGSLFILKYVAFRITGFAS